MDPRVQRRSAVWAALCPNLGGQKGFLSVSVSKVQMPSNTRFLSFFYGVLLFL